jgi:hypothetical protein
MAISCPPPPKVFSMRFPDTGSSSATGIFICPLLKRRQEFLKAQDLGFQDFQ